MNPNHASKPLKSWYGNGTRKPLPYKCNPAGCKERAPTNVDTTKATPKAHKILRNDRDCLVRQYLARAQIARLTEMHGAGGGAMAAHAAGRLDMMGHNMMQESTGFGSKGDDGERD